MDLEFTGNPSPVFYPIHPLFCWGLSFLLPVVSSARAWAIIFWVLDCLKCLALLPEWKFGLNILFLWGLFWQLKLNVATGESEFLSLCILFELCAYVPKWFLLGFWRSVMIQEMSWCRSSCVSCFWNICSFTKENHFLFLECFPPIFFFPCSIIFYSSGTLVVGELKLLLVFHGYHFSLCFKSFCVLFSVLPLKTLLFSPGHIFL